MTIHCTRDFLSNVSAISPSSQMYFTLLFMTGVLGYSRIGHTNMNINPSAKGFVVSGSGASINLGAGKEYYVFVPTASYTVPASSDNGKVLVLKSFNYPLANSGLYRVLSGSVADNAFIIDYRTPGGVNPPIESGSLSGSLDWMLFAAETTFAPTETFADNGGAGNSYQTQGSATYPRIIMRSPHPTGWQVRLCAESGDDRITIGNFRINWTTAPGISGTLAGDFPTATPCLHGAQFWNDNEANRRTGQQAGMSTHINWATGQWRSYLWGDDVTGTVWHMIRNVSVGSSGFGCFGMPENEPQPVPAEVMLRLFNAGCTKTSTFNQTPSWNIGTTNEYSATGQAWGIGGVPISLVFSSWHIIYADQAPRANVTTDNPALKATDLVPVDLLAGTWLTQYIRGTTSVQNMSLEPRRLGFAPIARQGRNNFAQYTVSTDPGKTWFHTVDGMFFPWGGLSVLP